MKKVSTVTTEKYEITPIELGNVLVHKEDGVVSHIYMLGFYFTVEQFRSFSTDLQNILQDIELNEVEVIHNEGSKANEEDCYLNSDNNDPPCSDCEYFRTEFPYAVKEECEDCKWKSLPLKEAVGEPYEDPCESCDEYCGDCAYYEQYFKKPLEPL